MSIPTLLASADNGPSTAPGRSAVAVSARRSLTRERTRSTKPWYQDWSSAAARSSSGKVAQRVLKFAIWSSLQSSAARKSLMAR